MKLRGAFFTVPVLTVMIDKKTKGYQTDLFGTFTRGKPRGN
jgi:hypothetical protein